MPLQALQDHLTEQCMRQLLGTEPLQTVLRVISKNEEHDNKPYYIRLSDSMDPVAALQSEQQEKEEGNPTDEASIKKSKGDIGSDTAEEAAE